MKRTGTIQRVVKDRGFGFLRCESSGLEYFFHRSGLTDGLRFELLEPGMGVMFDVGERQGKGEGAVNIQRN